MTQTKHFTTLIQKELNDDEMSLVAYANKSNVIDRSGDIIADDAWDLESFTANPVICAFHQYNRAPIAKALWIKVVPGQGLRMKIKFAGTDEGKEFYQLYKEGVLNAFSVGFRGIEYKEPEDFDEKDVKRYMINGKMPSILFTKVELFEVSAVAVPDNQASLVERHANGALKTKSVQDFITESIKEINLESIQSEEYQKELDLENIEIKDETVTKSETTENYHRIPVIPKEQFIQTSFRTIDITSGIKAVIGNLKSDPNGSTHVHTYLFDVNKFSMSEAEAWVEEHKKEISDENVEIKSVGSSSLPTSDKPEWDSAAAISRMSSAAGGPNKDEIDWTKYSKGFAYFDSSNKENFGSYKLPFADVIGGTLTAVWGGVNAAMAAVNGARTPMSIPESDRKAAYNLLKSYYTKFDKEAPEFKDISEDIEEKAKKPCKKEMCDGEECQEFDSCSEPMKKAKDASEEPMDGNEEPMPCEDGEECPGIGCVQYKGCSKPMKKEEPKCIGEAHISLKVTDSDLDIMKELMKEIELLKEEINNLKEKHLKVKDVLFETDIVKELKDHIDSKFETKEVQKVDEDIVFEIEQKEIKSALDESLEIDITKEQLGELIKDAILNVTKESKKNNEIDLSQITMDALKKAKGEIF